MNKLDTGLISSSTWVIAGIVLAAKTGLDYRKLRNNEIEEEKFNENLRQNTASTLGSTIGSIAGIAIGVPLGAFVGIGALIGAAVMGVSGGIYGSSAMLTAEEALEYALVKNESSNVFKMPS